MDTETTAVVKIKPENDPVFQALVTQATELKQCIVAREIKSDDDVKLATDDLAILSKLRKEIEEHRKAYVGPIKEHLDAVNMVFKTITEPLFAADQETRAKILKYNAEQKRKADEAEEINRLRMEAARKEMELKGELTESVEVIEAPPVPPKTVHANVGTSSTVPVAKFEVTDISLVPPEFLKVDMVALGKQIRAGRRNIPGVRIWMEDTLRVKGGN